MGMGGDIGTTATDRGASEVGEVRGSPLPARTVASDDYLVVDEIARGGMGRILRAWDRRHDRLVAIKVLLHTTPETVRRFGREARLTARLQHPSIVPLYEIGHWSSGEPFFAMKLVTGRSLRDVIVGAKTLDERLACLPLIVSVADALA